ncbi:MAG: acylneuraminate cytidylyltransferase family protein [Thermodesulfobacteriota bacterium]
MEQPFTVGVIPARGGSKRIPMKNVKPLLGVPLIGYMIRAAAESGVMSRFVVSTDHPEIKRFSLAYGAEVPFDRPADISWDCPSEMVAKHAVAFMEKEAGRKADFVVFMQPTTPFCLPEDIAACVRMLQARPDWDSVFSVLKVHQRPEWMFSGQEDGTGTIFLAGELKGERGIVQSLPDLFMPNGAVYVTRRVALMEDDLILCPKTGIYLMPPERCVDIDEPIDFEYAEFIGQKLKAEHGIFHPALGYSPAL